jgi:hypothetical protein
LRSEIRAPAGVTAQALARRSPPPMPSVVEEAMSHCSAQMRRSSPWCHALSRPWRTRIATMI